MDNQMVTKCISERFVDNILAETIANVASLSPRLAAAAEADVAK